MLGKLLAFRVQSHRYDVMASRGYIRLNSMRRDDICFIRVTEAPNEEHHRNS
jgi:hypothetical protein